jgi:hypothetical protein
MNPWLHHFYVSATIVHWHDPATQAAALYFNQPADRFGAA